MEAKKCTLVVSTADNLKPFLRVSSFIAILPFYDYEKRKFFTHKIFSYFWVLTSIALNAYSFYGKMLMFSGSASLVVLNNTSLLISAFANNIATLAATSRNLPKFQEIFDGFDQIDFKTREFTSIKIPTVRSINYQFYSLQVFILASICCDVYIWHFMLDSIVEYRFFFNDVIQVYLLANMAFVQSNILLSIKNRYYVINEGLEALDTWLVKVINVNNIGDAELNGKIKSITRVHNKICDIVDLFNEIFGWHILLSIFNIVISLLGCIDVLLHSGELPSANIFLIVVWSVFIAIQGILVATMCEKVMDEGKRTIAIAYKAMHRFSTIAPVRDKLYVLAQQSTARCPVFTAAGFFNVDFAMLFTFVNLITTYVIVIIQFSTPQQH